MFMEEFFLIFSLLKRTKGPWFLPRGDYHTRPTLQSAAKNPTFCHRLVLAQHKMYENLGSWTLAAQLVPCGSSSQIPGPSKNKQLVGLH